MGVRTFGKREDVLIARHNKLEISNRGGVDENHRGFTLVEVIVVLVILAILAAIAIPALTGYIEKADDNKYIAEARNFVVALHTVLDEAYADGELASVNISKGSSSVTNKKMFDLGTGGSAILQSYLSKAAQLVGAPLAAVGVPGIYNVQLLASNSPGSTVLTAEGFICMIRPEGYGKPAVYVTYGLPRLTTNVWDEYAGAINGAQFDPAIYGYEVYHW